MDNPKKANQGKYSRSKRKKEYFGKGGSKSGAGGGGSNDNNEKPHQHNKDDRSKQNTSNVVNGSRPSNANAVQQTTSTSTAGDRSSKTDIDAVAEQKVVIGNLKKETEEIANLTQKYGRRRIISTWTRDFEIPPSEDSFGDDNDEGADFKELIGESSTFFVGRHFMLKEEREWLNQMESCESPFSLDLKSLEAGISSIPFYKRHDLSEKSFNPKEIQLMNSEAESNRVIYNKMKSETQETQKVVLNKQTSDDTNDNLICRDLADDNVMKAVKNSDEKTYEDVFTNNKIESKDTSLERGSKVIEGYEGTSVIKSSPSEKNDRRFNKTVSKTDEFDVTNSLASFDGLAQRNGRRNTHRQNDNLVVVDSQSNISTEHLKTITSNDCEENNINKNTDLSYPDFVSQSLEPRSQRRPRREIRQEENKVCSNENYIKHEMNDTNFTECSFIGLNPRSRKNIDNNSNQNEHADDLSQLQNEGSSKNNYNKVKLDEMNSWDVTSSKLKNDVEIETGNIKQDFKNDLVNEVHKPSSDSNYSVSTSDKTKGNLTSIQDEIDNVCGEFSIILTNKFKNDKKKDDDCNEEGVLNLNCLKKVNDVVSNDHNIININKRESNSDSGVVNIVNDGEFKILMVDPIKTGSKEFNKSDNHLSSSCNTNQPINDKNIIKTNESLLANYDDDDLDFLLGLDKPANVSLLAVQKSNDPGSSNLSILQEKLKVTGSDLNNGTNKSNVITKSVEVKNAKVVSTQIVSDNQSPDVEDLDEWLDSVLEN